MPSIFIFFAHAGFLVVASCGAGLFHERANFTKTHVVFATFPVVDAYNNDVYLQKVLHLQWLKHFKQFLKRLFEPKNVGALVFNSK